MGQYRTHFEHVNLRLKYNTNSFQNFESSRRNIIKDIYIYGTLNEPNEEKATMKIKSYNKINTFAFVNQIEKNANIIFWKTLYTLVLLAIFAERSYYKIQNYTLSIYENCY